LSSTRPDNLIFDLIFLEIFFEYELWSSSLCNFLHHAVEMLTYY
jgi:hypothetical protein